MRSNIQFVSSFELITRLIKIGCCRILPCRYVTQLPVIAGWNGELHATIAGRNRQVAAWLASVIVAPWSNT
ncbi:hypothetical protein ACVBEG_27690 [Pseudomonas sp. GG8]